jgi:hypothetical protein
VNGGDTIAEIYQSVDDVSYNTMRRVIREREAYLGKSVKSRKLTADQVRAIRENETVEGRDKLVEECEISQGLYYQIRRRLAYADIPDAPLEAPEVDGMTAEAVAE